MRSAPPSIARRIPRLLIGILATCGSSQMQAADIYWTGVQSDSWQTIANWQFMGPIQPIPRIPADVDFVHMTSPASDAVALYGNTAPINGMILSNGIFLRTNGHLLQVDNAGSATTAIAGSAVLYVEPRNAGLGFETDNLLMSGGGELRLLDDVVIEGNTVMGSGSLISDEVLIPGSVGTISFGGDVTLFDSDVKFIDGFDAVFSPGSTIELNDFSLMELKQSLSIGGNTTLNLKTNSTLRVSGTTTIGPTGKLAVTSSAFRPGDHVVIDGGTFSLADGPFAGTIQLAPAKHFTARNNAQILLDDKFLFVQDQQSFAFESGASVSRTPGDHSGIFVGSSATTGELLIDGVGTNIDLSSIIVGTSAPGESVATIRNGATVALDSLRVNNSFNFNVPHPNRATMNIESDASVVGLTSVSVGTIGNFASSYGRLNLSSGASLIQSPGNGENNVGSMDSTAEGRITVSDGAAFTSNANDFNVRAKGVIEVQGGAQAGVMTINGPLHVEGAIDVNDVGSPPGGPGGVLHVTAPMTIDGGSVTLAAGHVTALSVGFAGGGIFNFNGGALTVDSFENDLSNLGGTFAPEGVASIVGQYMQHADGALAIDIGGLIMGSDYDSVDISHAANLDGALLLALAPGFVPDQNDEFTILDAGMIAGSFSNAGNGQRLRLPSGGSFLVHYGAASAFDPAQVVLTDFQEAAAADFDKDGDVDAADVAQWQEDFGLNGDSDADGDGDSDGADFLIWQRQLGTGVNELPASHLVPEPDCTVLLAVLLILRAFAGPARSERRDPVPGKLNEARLEFRRHLGGRRPPQVTAVGPSARCRRPPLGGSPARADSRTR